MGDEGLDEVAGGPAEGLRSAKIRGVSLDESRIKAVLADEKA